MGVDLSVMYFLTARAWWWTGPYDPAPFPLGSSSWLNKRRRVLIYCKSFSLNHEAHFKLFTLVIIFRDVKILLPFLSFLPHSSLCGEVGVGIIVLSSPCSHELTCTHPQQSLSTLKPDENNIKISDGVQLGVFPLNWSHGCRSRIIRT